MPKDVIACYPDAIAASDREAHFNRAKQVLATILDVTELPDGYRFRLPLSSDMILLVSQWIINERLCCPFLRFSIHVDEQLWLHLTGSDGVKAFIAAEIVSNVDTSITE